MNSEFALVLERLERIETQLGRLASRHTQKEFYSTDEAAEILGKAPFTVRNYCRLGRIRGVKRRCGRGLSQEWMIPHAELERVRNEGLLPLPKHAG